MASKRKIIIVDDDPSFRRMLKMRLEREGYDCRAYGAAFLVEERVFSEWPDLIIVDRWLSDVDGIEWAGLIKNVYPRLPVIIVTALKSAVETPDERFDRIHPKPVDWSDLMRDIEELTGMIRLDPEPDFDKSCLETKANLSGCGNNLM